MTADPARLVDLVLSDGQDGAFRRAAMVLAICITLPRDQLGRLLTELWPDDGPDVTSTLDALLASPAVENTRAGWRMNNDLAPHIARRFLEEDPIHFERAHELLVEWENNALDALSMSIDGGAMESWFIRSRVAFYLAGVHADESVTRFGQAFDTAPQQQLRVSRMWLSTLVLRQATLLAGHHRALAFFRGFRAYTTGNRSEARRHFDDVLRDESIEDLYRAIALHLYTMGLGTKEASVRYLEESIALSKRLGLRENEIMARNTLVTTWMGLAVKSRNRGDSASERTRLERAATLAVTNLEGASGLSPKSYLAYTLLQRANTTWMLAVGVDRHGADEKAAQAVVHEVLADYQEALEIADAQGLAETAVRALNSQACVRRDIGDLHGAVSDLEEIVERVWLVGDRRAIQQVAKTAGSLAHRVQRELAPRLDGVRSSLTKWQDEHLP